jgi:pimeloyl-ACP methyl ester carboxylesterase
VVTIDLAGHGESGLARSQWTMGAFGEDVASVVRELDLQGVVLVGHSMGGPVVVEAARRLGERVAGIVGVDTFNDLSFAYSEEEIREYVEAFQADFVETTKGIVRGMFLPESDPELATWIAEDMSSADPGVGLGALEQMIAWYDAESRAAFEEIPAPLRLINSDYNPTNLEAAREYAPSIEAAFMSNVGHFVMMEDPETFNELLAEAVAAILREE